MRKLHPIRQPKEIVQSVAIHADVTVGDATEMGATGMAAMLPILRAMVTCHLLQNHVNANPNLNAMQHQS